MSSIPAIPGGGAIRAPQATQDATATPPAAPPRPAAGAADTFEDPTRRVDYSAIGGPSANPVVKQDKSEDCGEAAVATIVKQLGGSSAGQDPKALMADLKQRFAGSHAGTTPEEMVQMLAHEGFAATKRSTNFDQGAADAALASGGRVMVLADSHQLRPEGANSTATGAAHWVVIDGKDAAGNYTVSDPLDGSRYTTDLGHVAKAMNASWQSHQGGGMLVAQKALGQSEQDLVNASADRDGVMGEKPGIGSNSIRYGQETN
jgi:predicted double-glycine peptidase